MSGPEAFGTMRTILPLRNTIDPHAAGLTAHLEHVDAIVQDIGHIAERRSGPIDDQARYTEVNGLLGQFVSGAAPSRDHRT